MQQSPPHWRKYISPLILGFIIIFYLINGTSYLRSQSITSDEGSFMHYAIRYLKGHPERVYPRTDNSKMPVTILNTLPRITRDVLHGNTAVSDGGLQDTMQGRYITLALSVFTILLVFTWSRQLYGEWAGLFSAFLMSFCPNSLANAGLVTTDSYSALFLLWSMYLLWKFCRLRTVRYFILFSIAVALSQLVKQSLFHLYVLAPLCMLVYFLVYREKFRWTLFLQRLLIFAAASLVIINAGYYFTGSFTSLGDHQFMSQLFQSLQQVFPHSLPVPFPKPFTDGLDMAKYYDQVGGGVDKLSSFGKVTILGKSATGSGFWYYYFVSVFYKTPIVYFVFFIWSFVILWRKRTFKTFVAHEFFLMAPVVYFFLVMSFFYQTQCGLRHIIFIYPFIFILCGAITGYLKKTGSKIIFTVLCLYLVISVLRYWNNYFPYTNEFIPDKKMAFEKVGSGNLEFHQGYYFAMDYMKKHPGVQWAPVRPASGRFLIDTEQYLDIWNRHEYDWISVYKPVGHVAYNFLLIDVPHERFPAAVP